jgi:hypothetical protein
MANHEHVALLKQGVAAWNAWRTSNQPRLAPVRVASLRFAATSFASQRIAPLRLLG